MSLWYRDYFDLKIKRNQQTQEIPALLSSAKCWPSVYLLERVCSLGTFSHPTKRRTGFIMCMVSSKDLINGLCTQTLVFWDSFCNTVWPKFQCLTQFLHRVWGHRCALSEFRKYFLEQLFWKVVILDNLPSLIFVYFEITFCNSGKRIKQW